MQVESAIKVLEDAVFRTSEVGECFERVAELLNARTFHMTHDPGSGVPDFVIAKTNRPFLEAYVKGNWNDLDIWTQRCRKLRSSGGPDLFTDIPLISDEDRYQSPFFQEFYADWDVAHVASWCFNVEDDELGFVIKRPRGLPFSEEDIESLRSFRRAANRVGLLLSRFHQQHVLGFLQGLEASNRPSITLNHRGEVSYLTPSAEKLVGDGFSIRRGIPYGTTPRSEAGFLALRQWALQGGGSLPDSFIIDRLASRHPIAAIPIAIPDNGLLALPHARAVIMLLDLSGRMELPKKAIQSMFGLTNREVDVALLLACGIDAAEISERLGLKLTSARQLIKSVLSKANVRRQSELAAILGRLN